MQQVLFELEIIHSTNDADRDERNRLSKTGEFLAAAELTALGFDVSLAAEKLAYDLLADRDGTILKVQVKTASYDAAQDRYLFCTTRCSHKGSGKSRPYGVSDVDVFAFVAVDRRAAAFFPSREVVSSTAFALSRVSFELRDLARASMDRTMASILAAA